LVSPFLNLSSAAPDLPVFFTTVFAKLDPPLGSAGGPQPCQVTCESTVSQQAADLCAQELGLECTQGPWTSPVNGVVSPPASSRAVPPPQNTAPGQPFPRLFNQAQFCGAPCPDGSVFTYTVPAGVFSALAYGNSPAAIAAGQAKANNEAFTYACRQAQLHIVCLGPLNVLFPPCANQPFLATIAATGRFLAVAPASDTWTLTAGQLPPGLTFHGGSFAGGIATIDGTPTQLGTFSFTIQITAPSGDTMSKQFTVTIRGIPNAGQQPDGKVGTAYSDQLFGVGYINPVFTLVSGSLPAGLSLSSTGLITGTPTTGQTTTATIQVAESDGTGACQAQVSIKITAGFQFNLTWGAPATATAGDGAVSSTTSPNGATLNASASAGLNGALIDYQFGGGAGFQVYTSATPINCNVKLTLTGHVDFAGGVFQGGNALVYINGVFVGSTGLTAPGTANFPFTLPAGVNQRVDIEVTCSANTSELFGQGANLKAVYLCTTV